MNPLRWKRIFTAFGLLAALACLLAAPALAQVAPPSVAAAAGLANPYGLQAMWQDGGIVTRGTLLVLLVMSVASWYVIVIKLAEQSVLLRQARNLPASFWAAQTPALSELPVGTVYWSVARAGIAAKEEHVGELTRNVDLNSWIAGSIQNALDDVQSRLQGGLALLATVGATSPFVGLFGTVWGIYQALTAIGIAGQASIDKVAGPVGEALIMTALGLAVAVPAVLGYNWLGRRNRLALAAVRVFGTDLHARLLGRTTKVVPAMENK